MKKVLALYLPQYHETPENDKWWGKGYTEWTAVMKAHPLYKNHKQPKIPLNNHYYDLVNQGVETWMWQSKLAKENGIYGFAIYHYWFGNDKMMLEKPARILLDHKEIEINFCFVWANESWTRTWYGLDKETLVEQTYGDYAEWEKHFNYFLEFFKDNRYIRVDGKPMINIYRSKNIEKLDEMLLCWDMLAKKHGFPGLHIVVCNSNGLIEDRLSHVDAFYNFEPTYSMKYNMCFFDKALRNAKIALRLVFNHFKKNKTVERIEDMNKAYKLMSKNFRKKYLKPVYYGIFPSWDNTPRRGYKGSIYAKSSPTLFCDFFKKTYDLSCKNSFIFVNAWNEWGEGCYLEPDEENKYGYLKKIKKVINNE